MVARATNKSALRIIRSLLKPMVEGYQTVRNIVAFSRYRPAARRPFGARRAPTRRSRQPPASRAPSRGSPASAVQPLHVQPSSPGRRACADCSLAIVKYAAFRVRVNASPYPRASSQRYLATEPTTRIGAGASLFRRMIPFSPYPAIDTTSESRNAIDVQNSAPRAGHYVGGSLRLDRGFWPRCMFRMHARL